MHIKSTSYFPTGGAQQQRYTLSPRVTESRGELNKETETASNPDPTSDASKSTTDSTTGAKELTAQEQQVVEQLKARDTEVRAHEMAHITSGGSYITSGASFSYQRGPDGELYAIGGEVSIDASPIPGDPEATIRKMETVSRAALPPASPSAQYRKVAAKARLLASQARIHSINQKNRHQDTDISPATDNSPSASPRQASETYTESSKAADAYRASTPRFSAVG